MDTQHELLILIKQLSEKYTGSPWSKEVEFKLYLQLSGWQFENVFCMEYKETKQLRELSQKLAGWFIYNEAEDKIEFICYFDWNSLYQEWHYRSNFKCIKYIPEN
mgnify:CR=1 FL=1